MERTRKNLSDEDLMDLLKAGQPHAFETLFLRHKNKVYGYLLKRSAQMGAQSGMEDLLQEIFEKVYYKAHTFNNQMMFLPWLFTISKNTLVDWARKNGREKEINEHFELISSLPPQSQDSNVDLSSLAPRYREALELRYMKDLDFSEISKQMNVSVSNARQLISRALKLLKMEIKNEKR